MYKGKARFGLLNFFFFFFTHKTELKSKFDSTAPPGPTQYLEQRQLKNRQRILARKTLFLNDVQQRKD